MLSSKSQAPRGGSFYSPFDAHTPQKDELDWTRRPASGISEMTAADLNPFDGGNATNQPDLLSSGNTGTLSGRGIGKKGLK